ncbi:dipeptidase [Paenibacillus thermotolerans]|uniref:dipeptidase n=1 Tax=Paenibacillus thermotolerans TaxID=3027807 RepID=UPI0023676617|nr:MULTISPECIES: dipeptidase [unclassified Paenibacillus]
MVMKRMDLHCDALSKMLIYPNTRFEDDARLDVTYQRLKSADMAVQAFAIYIPEEWNGRPFDAVLRSVDLFRRHVAAHPGMRFIQTKEDLEQVLQPAETKIGALLTLEGADGLEANFTYLRIAWDLGVRTLGLTWNFANWAADGAREARGGGFTHAGKKLIEECDSLGLTLDVSHLSEKAFWELTELGKRPFIASHSNMRAICDHPRNLTDEQVKAIIALDGRIGITFVPYFLRSDGKEAGIDDVLTHIERVCELGGVSKTGFGSDFDGISEWVKHLEHPGKLHLLENELHKRYSPEQVEGFMGKNFTSFYIKWLPEANNG